MGCLARQLNPQSVYGIAVNLLLLLSNLKSDILLAIPFSWSWPDSSLFLAEEMYRKLLQ